MAEMTNPTYRLSNRQQKELLVRGQQLLIAIPCTEDCDPVQFARESLPEHARYVTHAEHAQVVVVHAKQGGTGLTAVLGQLYHDDCTVDGIRCAVDVVIVTLRPLDRCRGEVDRLSWPGVGIVGESVIGKSGE